MKRTGNGKWCWTQLTMLLGILGISVPIGCNSHVEENPKTVEPKSQERVPGEKKALSNAAFLGLLQAGRADQTDLTSVISTIVHSSETKIEPLTEASDPYRLKYWKDFLEGDEFVDTSNLAALQLLDVTTGPSMAQEGGGSPPPGDRTSTVLFIQLKSSSDWIYWARQLHEGASTRFDLAVPSSTLTSLINHGLSDKTDFTRTISELYSLENQKKTDPDLTKVSVVSSKEVTDVTRLNALNGLLEGDSTLIPSRVGAIKVFDLEIEEAFQPARPATEHADLPHDGKNSVMVLFVKSKISEEWRYWGSYL